MIESIYIVIGGMIIFVILIAAMIYYVLKKRAFKKATFIFIVSIILLLITFSVAAKIDKINSERTMQTLTKVSDLKITMNTNEINYYTEETIKDFLDYSDDSTDQTDTLNASIEKTDWVLEELKAKFNDDDAKNSIQTLATDINKISSKLKNKEYESNEEFYEDSKSIEKQIEDIANTYLDGNFPPSAMSLTK